MPDNMTSLTVRIDAKTHWLAYYAAREQGMTLAEFVESLIRKGITRKAMLADEPKVTGTTAQEPLWNESLWDDDEATRLFNVARAHPSWLSRSEQKLWTVFCSLTTRPGAKMTVKGFRYFYARVKENHARTERN